MRPIFSLFVFLMVAAFCFMTCSKDKVTQTPQGPVFSDPMVTFLNSQLGTGDTIDSTGTFLEHGDTTIWYKPSGARMDTLPAVILVRGDSADVGGIRISVLPLPVAIHGLKAAGTVTTFPGNVWRVTSVSTDYLSQPLTAGPTSDMAMFLYFCPANHKVYVAQKGSTYEKLYKNLMLTCPYAFLGPVLPSFGVFADSVRSDCDTIWAVYQTGPTASLDVYIVGNTTTQSLDVFMAANRFMLTSMPLP